MKRVVLVAVAVSLVLGAAAILVFSPLTPFTRTEMSADRVKLLGDAVAVTLNRRAAEGWLLKERINLSDDGYSTTLVFTRQVPWHAPAAPTATVIPTPTPAPPTKGPAVFPLRP